MPIADTALGPIFYTQNQGPRSSPPVLLVHGAAGSHIHWPAQLRRFPSATAYTLDLPGHGRSPELGDLTIEGYADAVYAFSHALETGPFILVGHSMGSAVALTLACEHPGIVVYLILLAAGSRFQGAEKIAQAVRRDLISGMETFTRTLWDPDITVQRLNTTRRYLQHISPELAAKDLQICSQFKAPILGKNSHPPTLVLTGTEDKIAQIEDARLLAHHTANSQFVPIEGAGHMALMTHTDVILREIAAFLRRS